MYQWVLRRGRKRGPEKVGGRVLRAWARRALGFGERWVRMNSTQWAPPRAAGRARRWVPSKGAGRGTNAYR